MTRSCCYSGTSVTNGFETAYHQRLLATSRTAHRWAHSHALSAIWAGDLVGDGDHVDIGDLEMLKGIRGLGNGDVHSMYHQFVDAASAPLRAAAEWPSSTAA